MKVALEVTVEAVTTRYWLIGQPDVSPRVHSDAMAITRQLQRQQQLSQSGAGWEAVRHYDRGNKGLVIEASTYLEFVDEATCFDFCNSFSLADADAPHPMEGTVLLRQDQAGTWQDALMESAVIMVLAVDQVGSVGARLRYRFAGGLLTDGDTGDYSWLLTEDGAHLMTEDGRFIALEDHEE